MEALELKTGLKLNNWELLDKNTYRKGHWWVLCACGNERSVRADALRYGTSQSCGCRRSNLSIGDQRLTHGLTGTPEHRSWVDMRTRVKRDAHYIRKGIAVCDRWQDFKNFLLDMGPKPKGRSLGRIGNDGHYSPFNCRWETPAQQNANKGDTVFVESETFGSRSAQEWVAHLMTATGDDTWTVRRLRMYLQNGMTIDRLLKAFEVSSLNAECAEHFGSELVAA